MDILPLRAAKALYAYAVLANNPSQLNKVFDLRSSIEDPKVAATIVKHLRQFPSAARALDERPRLAPLQLDELSRYPEGTLGHAFAAHMRAAKLDPAAIPTLPADNENAYVSAHLYETHDIWHVITGFDVDIAGELGLQAFYLAQFPAFLAAAILSAGLLNTMLKSMDDRTRRMDAIARGWTMGRTAAPLFGVRWQDRWGQNLDELRRELLDVSPAPVPLSPSSPRSEFFRSLA
jgi:ubiquinone biosynthesis protein Coq4